MPITTTRPVKTRGAAAYRQYLQDSVDCQNYYSDGDGFDKAWGSLAAELGLEGGVSAEAWDGFFRGEIDGKSVVRAGRKVGAHDLTFSTPKSFGEAMVSGDSGTRADFEESLWIAAKAAVEYGEATTIAVRKRHIEIVNGKRQSVQRHYTGKWLCTPVLQYSARPTPATIARNAPPDVHVHIHAAVMSMMKFGDEYLTADNWAFKINAEHINEVFSGELSRQLELRGYRIKYTDIERSKNAKIQWELDGSSKQARDHWSSNRNRRNEIEDEFRSLNGKPLTEEEIRQKMYLTRERKSKADKAQDTRPVWELWREDARTCGVKVMRVRQRSPIVHNPEASAAKLRERLMGPAGLVRDDGQFTEESIGQTIRRCAVGLGLTQAELQDYEDVITAGLWPDVVPVKSASRPDERLWTTRPLLEAEEWLSDKMDELRREGRILVVEAAAGSGKTTVMRTLADVGRHPGPNALGTALHRGDQQLDREQIEVVRRGTAMFSDRTMDRFVTTSVGNAIALELGEEIEAEHKGSTKRIVAGLRHGMAVDDSTVVMVEEAFMLDSLRAFEVIEALEQRGKPVYVMLGDRKQSTAIGPTGWLNEWADSNRDAVATLQNVYRQKDPRDIEAYQAMREGHAEVTLTYLEERGRLHQLDTMEDAVGQVYLDYMVLRSEGVAAKDILIVTDASNAQVDHLNWLIQLEREARGEISDKFIEIDSEKTGRRWRLHKGDDVMLTEGIKTPSGYLANSTPGRVTELHDDSTVTFKRRDGRKDRVPAEIAMPKYAVHSARAQGFQAQHVMGLVGARTSQNTGYTIISRGIEATHVYYGADTIDRERLVDAWRTPDERMTAHRAIERYRQEEPLVDLDMAPAHGERQRRPVDVMEEVPRVPQREPYRHGGREL